MSSKMCGVVVCGLFLGCGIVSAQINLMADQINFRDANSQGAVTTHNGEFDSYGDWAGGYFSGGYYGAYLSGRNTGAYAYGSTYGVNASVYPNGLGATTWGGYFTSPRLGTGYGTNDPTQTCVGVYGYGQGGGSIPNYYGAGVEAKSDGGNSAALYAHGGSWAGFFEGNIDVRGSIYVNDAWVVSDEKLKTQIAPLTSSLGKILQLQPKTYFFDTLTYQKMNLPKTKQIGLVAQDVETVFPDLVTKIRTFNFPDHGDSTFTDKHGKLVHIAKAQSDSAARNVSVDTLKTVNYMALIPVLIAALQEQQKEIEALKSGKLK